MFFHCRMNLTPKEKEMKEYKIGLTRAALGEVNRNRGRGESRETSAADGRETSSGSVTSDNADVSKFESLRWKDDMTILTKRRKTETKHDKEILEKNRLRGRTQY